jgi:hypothetical protein
MGRVMSTGVALASLLGLWACQEESAIERYKRLAPPQPLWLWSIAVVERGVETAPVTLCANDLIRAGFNTPLPASDGTACALMSAPEIGPDQAKMRCALGGRPFEVRAFTRGDPAKDFLVDFRMRGLDAERLVLRQTRHYRLLGACPAGWIAGDTTDRQGRRRANVLNGAGAN